MRRILAISLLATSLLTGCRAAGPAVEIAVEASLRTASKATDVAIDVVSTPFEDDDANPANAAKRRASR
jgi:hypothetical protein